MNWYVPACNLRYGQELCVIHYEEGHSFLGIFDRGGGRRGRGLKCGVTHSWNIVHNIVVC